MNHEPRRAGMKSKSAEWSKNGSGDWLHTSGASIHHFGPHGRWYACRKNGRWVKNKLGRVQTFKHRESAMNAAMEKVA